MSQLQFHLISKQTVQEGKAYLQDLIAHYFEFLSEVHQPATEISGDEANTGIVCQLKINPQQGKIGLGVNGLTTVLTNQKTEVAYFSKDGGATTTSDYEGATLFWNESVAGFKLKPWHTVQFFSGYADTDFTS